MLRLEASYWLWLAAVAEMKMRTATMPNTINMAHLSKVSPTEQNHDIATHK
jgi:hypothetical protein